MLRRSNLAALLLAALLPAACVTPPRRKPRALTARQRTLIDQEFYMAVAAYANGDYPASSRYIAQILALSPRNKDARALRQRLRAAQRAQLAGTRRP